MVAGAPIASQKQVESLKNVSQAKRPAAPAILAKPGQLVYIP
jgi:hypothetical protein